MKEDANGNADPWSWRREVAPILFLTSESEAVYTAFPDDPIRAGAALRRRACCGNAPGKEEK